MKHIVVVSAFLAASTKASLSKCVISKVLVLSND